MSLGRCQGNISFCVILFFFSWFLNQHFWSCTTISVIAEEARMNMEGVQKFLQKFTEPLLRSLRSRGHFRGRGGQILISSIFRSFVVLGFWGPLTSATSATSTTSEGAQGFFSKVTFLKSVPSNKKMRYVTAFLSKFSTKSFHRGGVFVLACSHWTALDGYWTFCTIFCSKHI